MYAFHSIFQALQDVHTSAPLQSQYLYDNVFVFLTQSFLWSSTRLEVVYESTNQRKQFIRSSVLSISTDSSIFQNDTPTPYRIKKICLRACVKLKASPRTAGLHGHHSQLQRPIFFQCIKSISFQYSARLSKYGKQPKDFQFHWKKYDDFFLVPIHLSCRRASSGVK